MEPFIGQIIMFIGNFVPRGWASCDGLLLPINQNSALFSLMGTIYGGDGRTTFALPDLRGRVAMHPGDGPGLTHRPLGRRGGAEDVTLTVAQLPSHSHDGTIKVADQDGAISAAFKGVVGKRAVENNTSNTVEVYVNSDLATFNERNTLGGLTIGNAGGGQSINNIQPHQCVNYIIALEGIYPSRS